MPAGVELPPAPRKTGPHKNNGRTNRGRSRHETHNAAVVGDVRVFSGRRVHRIAGAPNGEAPGATPSAAESAPPRRTERIVYSSLRPGNWDIFTSRAPAPRRGASRIILGSITTPRSRPTAAGSCSRRSAAVTPISTRSRSTAAGEPRLLIDSPAMEDQVAFSPDGRSIAFVSTASGNADIYVLPFVPEETQSLAVRGQRHEPRRAAIFARTSRPTACASHSRPTAIRRCPATRSSLHAPARRRRLCDGSRRRQSAAAHGDARLGRLARMVRGRSHAVLLLGAAARDRRSADEPDPGARGRLSNLGDERRRLESARRDAPKASKRWRRP